MEPGKLTITGRGKVAGLTFWSVYCAHCRLTYRQRRAFDKGGAGMLQCVQCARLRLIPGMEMEDEHE